MDEAVCTNLNLEEVVYTGYYLGSDTHRSEHWVNLIKLDLDLALNLSHNRYVIWCYVGGLLTESS